MQMEIDKCTNEKCLKEFQVHPIGGGVPGGKEKEPIDCPYCGTTVRTEMTSTM
jgi:aspartate carbamoyltransferase regulatory subunit